MLGVVVARADAGTLSTLAAVVCICSSHGYKRGPLIRVVQIVQGAASKTFEVTLEDLLASISPAYVERRQQSLLAQLQVLAQNQENA